MYATRILNDQDRPELDAFLLRHADSSMILRGNLQLAGVVDRGHRFQGPYAGAFDGAGVLRAVAAHYQLGNLFAAADDEPALDAAVQAAVAASLRPVKGLIGLRALVRRARSVLGLEAAPVQIETDEGLYGVDLATLRVPALLSDPSVELRALRPDDRELVVGWLRAYEIETLHAEDSEELGAQVQRRFEAKLADGLRCLLTHRGVACATTGFNAILPDRVQVGGVFTPPAARRRGYARAVVAGSLLDARERGVARAILFTQETNLAAITAYRALGFERIGDFNLTLFR